MKKIILLTFFFISVSTISCSHDETIVQIVRTPLLKFDFNGNDSWTSNSYSFAPVSKVVVYPSDTSQSGQLFNRLTLQGIGTDSSKNTYQLIITFDAIDINQLAGIYSTAYSNQKGLAEVQLFDLTSNNSLSAFNLCGGNATNAIFEIQKQKLDERIITGTFQMTLCNARDSTQKINITNGILKDIKY